MADILTDTMRAAAFLSRFNLPAWVFDEKEATFERTARAVPFAGVAIAAGPALLFAVFLGAGASPLFSAALAVAALTLLTGALHEDGLADTADGFGGGRDRLRRLEIMKDSATGAYGAITLVLSIVLRISGLAALAEAGALAAALAFVGLAAVSRAGMVWLWHDLPQARTDGTAVAAGQPQEEAAFFAAGTGALIGLALFWPAVGALGALVALLFAAVAVVIFGSRCHRLIGGHTGDTLGATQQIGEIAALAGLVLTLGGPHM